MFVTLKRYLKLLDDRRLDTISYIAEIGRLQGVLRTMETENTRLRSDLDWFKLNFNMVQRERAQLIYAAIGVKTSILEFVPQTHNPEDALNQLPDLSRVGEDAAPEPEAGGVPRFDENASPDYSQMPGYVKTV
jgi:hypothetical protein